MIPSWLISRLESALRADRQVALIGLSPRNTDIRQLDYYLYIYGYENEHQYMLLLSC
jgi:hypothetical protein